MPILEITDEILTDLPTLRKYIDDELTRLYKINLQKEIDKWWEEILNGDGSGSYTELGILAEIDRSK